MYDLNENIYGYTRELTALLVEINCQATDGTHSAK
jgi:hypothetical protein